MMPRWLYLWPLHFVEIGYIIFGAIFLLARERSHGKTKKADRVSIVAIFIQALAFAIAWTIARKHFTPFLPMVDWRAQYLVATLIVVLVIASLIFVMAAVRTLGQQWSLQARVLEHHELVQRGPYRIVRHPIYTGMFGMLRRRQPRSRILGRSSDRVVSLLFRHHHPHPQRRKTFA